MHFYVTVFLPPIPPSDIAAALGGTEATLEAVAEMVRHLLPERRHRTCLRVVKRARHNSYRVKRTADKIIRRVGPCRPLECGRHGARRRAAIASGWERGFLAVLRASAAEGVCTSALR